MMRWVVRRMASVPARLWLLGGLLLVAGMLWTSPALSRQATPLRSRYGTAGSMAQVQALGLEWFYAGFRPAGDLAPGMNATYALPVSPPLDEATLAEYVALRPGNVWLIGNEPNVPPEFNIAPSASAAPDAYAEALAWYADTIERLDPTARLAGPNILNWSFTCLGCGGFQEGREWAEQMRAAYGERYNAEPPFDIWGIHIYDLDWVNLPNGNAPGQIEQIDGARGWLDAIPDLAARPMWLTEVGIHWAYPGYEVRGGMLYPTGEFQQAHVEAYMRDLFGWLNDNAEPRNIERWFLWLVYSGAEQRIGQWSGITLMDGPDADANVTRLGQVYQELAGIQ